MTSPFIPREPITSDAQEIYGDEDLRAEIPIETWIEVALAAREGLDSEGKIKIDGMLRKIINQNIDDEILTRVLSGLSTTQVRIRGNDAYRLTLECDMEITKDRLLSTLLEDREFEDLRGDWRGKVNYQAWREFEKDLPQRMDLYILDTPDSVLGEAKKDLLEGPGFQLADGIDSSIMFACLARKAKAAGLDLTSPTNEWLFQHETIDELSDIDLAVLAKPVDGLMTTRHGYLGISEDGELSVFAPFKKKNYEFFAVLSALSVDGKANNNVHRRPIP